MDIFCIFESLCIEVVELVIMICGLGVMVCIFMFIFYFNGVQVRVYDGFWL